MIKELFLPEVWNGKRFYSQRIIGFTIQEQKVSATQLYSTPSATHIEAVFTEEIKDFTENNFAKQAASTIKTILEKCKKPNQIRIAVPSSVVVFKELTVPFTEADKIKMVIEYEAEPMLPFSLEDAIVDFIITKKNPTKKNSEVLVAAIRKQDLKNIVDIYTNAGIDPSNITVDLFSLYGLYKQIPEYTKLAHGSALVDIGMNTTRIAFLINGQLQYIRTIQKGLETVAQHISKDTKLKSEDVLKTLKEYGLNNPSDEKYGQATHKHMVNLLHDIQFTLNSFSLKSNLYKGISKILFTGKSSAVNGLQSFSSNLLQIPCELFSCNKLLNAPHIKNKIKKTIRDWSPFLYSLGTALYYIPHKDFDLKQKEFARTHQKLIHKQLQTAIVLVAGIGIAISTHGYLQIRNITQKTHRAERKAIKNLKKAFADDYGVAKKRKLKDVIKLAEEAIQRKTEILDPFENEGIQPIEVLHELTKIVDKRRFTNVDTDRVTITREEKTSFAEVSGFFKGKPGEQFGQDVPNNFVALEKSFELSKTLLLVQKPIDFTTGEEGIKFTALLKLKGKRE